MSFRGKNNEFRVVAKTQVSVSAERSSDTFEQQEEEQEEEEDETDSYGLSAPRETRNSENNRNP